MQSDHFDLREWCREQVRKSGLTNRQIAEYSGFTAKTISYMMTHESGTIDSWQRVLNTLPHINRYELPSVPVDILHQCKEWDKLSKGESPTTHTLRQIIRKGLKWD